MFLVLLTGCLIEQQFGHVDPDTLGDDAGDGTHGEDAPSPWDDLQVSSVPELAFVALWDDVTGVDALDEANDQYPCRPGPSLWTRVHGAPRLDLIDVRGQVLGQIPLPEPLDPYDDPALQAISPTEALLVGRLDFSRRRAWDIDAATLEARELVAWESRAEVEEVTVRGVAHDLPAGITDVHPTRVGETLYLAAELAGASDAPPLDTPVLYAFDLDAPEAAPRAWTIGDLLPPELIGPELAAQLFITHLRPFHGELVMQITFYGPAWDGSDSSYGWRYLRVVFLPETGLRSWTLDVSNVDVTSWTEPVHRHTDAGRAALFTQYAFEVPEPALILYDTTRATRQITPADSTCVSGLALLDATAPTVLYSRHDVDGPDDYGNALIVHHAGREVWRIDDLKVGLGRRRAHVRGLVALE